MANCQHGYLYAKGCNLCMEGLLKFLNFDFAPKAQTTFQQEKTEKKPYKCPVCDGTGKSKEVVLDSLGHKIIEKACHACNGTGVLWG